MLTVIRFTITCVNFEQSWRGFHGAKNYIFLFYKFHPTKVASISNWLGKVS